MIERGSDCVQISRRVRLMGFILSYGFWAAAGQTQIVIAAARPLQYDVAFIICATSLNEFYLAVDLGDNSFGHVINPVFLSPPFFPNTLADWQPEMIRNCCAPPLFPGIGLMLDIDRRRLCFGECLNAVIN